jgi:hypothetical protein
MLSASTQTLKRLAALVWYLGVAVLLIKSAGQFLEADRAGAGPLLVAFAIFSGLLIGWIKAKYLFIKICRRNLERIDALKKPKLWQCYRIRFYFFLGLMILLGVFLARLAQDASLMLAALGVLELSIATALLVSSRFFWRG